MSEETTHGMSSNEEKTCGTCLFYYLDTANQTDKCMRFARFVEHVITDMTKDCNYWTDLNDS